MHRYDLDAFMCFGLPLDAVLLASTCHCLRVRHCRSRRFVKSGPNTIRGLVQSLPGMEAFRTSCQTYGCVLTEKTASLFVSQDFHAGLARALGYERAGTTVATGVTYFHGRSRISCTRSRHLLCSKMGGGSSAQTAEARPSGFRHSCEPLVAIT